jgi:hypothetical protein
MSAQPLEDALTQVLDVPTSASPSTRRPQGFRDTSPLPAFAQGEVTRLATGIGVGAASFAELARQLITAVQRWVSSPQSMLLPHEVFLLGRRLERLRLASHAAQDRLGGFAEQSARQTLQALPADRTPPDVAACARRLAEYIARSSAAATRLAAPTAAAAPAPTARPAAPRRWPLIRAFIVVAALGFAAWVYLR